jgi:CheY-like chemotaxis protein
VAIVRRLRQVIINLLSNAIKYNHTGGTARLGCELHGDEVVVLSVSDTGLGIPQEKLGDLFLPFERLGSEETGVEGTGLGMALTKSLVEAMGGRITVESEVGRGSTFLVDLPRAESPSERATPDKPATPAHRSSEAGGSVLYIEDNRANLELVEHFLLRRPSIALIKAVRGSLSIDLAREHVPDLVLLDLHLPDISGDQVLHRLGDDAATAAIPVIVLSADATPSQIRCLSEAGACSYLTKPLDVGKFLQAVDRVLGPKA